MLLGCGVIWKGGVGGITVPSINCLWSPVWRLSACLESGIIYNIPFNMQNLSKILFKLKLGNSKVLQITSYTPHKILLILPITTVVFLPSYELWGTRTWTSTAFVSLLSPPTPTAYRHPSY